MEQQAVHNRVVAAVLVLALAIPLVWVAVASGVSPTPDSIASAYPLTSSPETATVDAASSPDAVFSTLLAQGDDLMVEYTQPADADFDAHVYGPGASSLADTSAIVASRTGTLPPDPVAYTATSFGAHYIDIRAVSGSGETTVYSSIRRATSATLTSDREVVDWGDSAILSAGVTDSLGSPVTSGYVYLYRSYNNSSWTYVKRVALDADGSIPISVRPSRKSYYKIRYFPGNTTHKSSAFTPAAVVTPEVGLGAPVAPTSMICNKTYSVRGDLKPRHRAGTTPVRIQVYQNINDVWTLKRTVTAKISDYSSYSRYYGAITLNAPGKWRMRAYYPASSTHAATYSRSDYVTVPIQKATTVSGRVSDSTPAQNTMITLYATVRDPYGKPIKNAAVTFFWKRDGLQFARPAVTNSSGVASGTLYVGGMTPGKRVVVTIQAKSGGSTATGSTGFTPHRP